MQPGLNEPLSFPTSISPRGLQTSWAPATSIVPVGEKTTMRRFVLRTFLKAVISQVGLIIAWAIAVLLAQHPSGVYGYLTQELKVSKSLILEKYAPYLISIPFSVGLKLFQKNLSQLRVWNTDAPLIIRGECLRPRQGFSFSLWVVSSTWPKYVYII